MIDTNWGHFGSTLTEQSLSHFGLELWKVHGELVRWLEKCEEVANCTGLTGPDIMVLHAIRMKDIPKSLSTICTGLNKFDSFSASYSIKKLLKMGLIKKVVSHENKRVVNFQVTAKGVKNTDEFARIRSLTLKHFSSDERSKNLEEIIKALVNLRSLYSDAARYAFFTNN